MPTSAPATRSTGPVASAARRPRWCGRARVVRYGDMRAQVAGLEAVLADGRVLRHLGGLLKDNTGYHLPGLLTGSEGTLAVVTAARLRLVPRLEHRVVALLAVTSIDDAVTAVGGLRRKLPSLEAAELMVEPTLTMVCGYLGVPPPFRAP